jgi:hypothetical protein
MIPAVVVVTNLFVCYAFAVSGWSFADRHWQRPGPSFGLGCLVRRRCAASKHVGKIGTRSNKNARQVDNETEDSSITLGDLPNLGEAVAWRIGHVTLSQLMQQ